MYYLDIQGGKIVIRKKSPATGLLCPQDEILNFSGDPGFSESRTTHLPDSGRMSSVWLWLWFLKMKVFSETKRRGFPCLKMVEQVSCLILFCLYIEEEACSILLCLVEL